MSYVKCFGGRSLSSIEDAINKWIIENQKTTGKNTRITQTESLFIADYDVIETLVTYEFY